MVNFNGIEPFDILHKHEQDIPDIIDRIDREQQIGNVLLFIAGKGQTGKTNEGLDLGEELKKRGRKITYSFSIYDFFEIATDETRHNEVIIYDEPQQDIPNWWNELFTILKEIIESYGYLHHVLIVISPSQKNLFRLFNLFHFFCKMRKSWEFGKPVFYADFYILDNRLDGKNMFYSFQTKKVKKVSKEVWDKFFTLKQENYKKRGSKWRERIEEYKKKELQKELEDKQIEPEIAPQLTIPKVLDDFPDDDEGYDLKGDGTRVKL